MTDAEKYLFDVHGYLVIEDALSSDEVAAANAAVDHHADQISIRPNDLANGSTTLRGKTGRGDLGGMLTWDKPHCDVFRQMIAHPKLTPYLEELLGPGFRLEGLSMITMDEGAEGFWFHEGGEPFDRSRGFLYRNGSNVLWNDELRSSIDRCGSRRWRFCVFAPVVIRQTFLVLTIFDFIIHTKIESSQIPAKAGDAVLFVECLMHGGLPWVAEHQRRSVIIRYNSGVMGESLMG